MADWDYIECGFNAADETINFGTRNFAGIDNIYETSTLALIKNTEQEVNKSPSVNAIIQNGSIFFAINNRLRSFSDLLCSNVNFDVTFDDKIDVFSVTSDGKYLLLCLRTGDVYCFIMEDENQNMLYTDKFVENDNVKDPLFLNVFVNYNSQALSFFLISKHGQVYQISTEQNSERGTLKFSSKVLFEVRYTICTSSFIYPLLAVAGKEVSLYNLYTNELETVSINNLKKVFFINMRMLLGLDWNGNLLHICTKTFLIYSLNIDLFFDDILLIHDISGSRILGITKKNEVGVSHLQLLSYPGYSTIFSLKITDKINLITPEHIHDEIIYISEMRHDENVSEIRIQVVTETAPENRLKRLLRREKFDEAEQFAKLFHLDLSEIQKAKAQAIVDKTICDQSDIDNLLNILDKVQDDAFKLTSCLNVHNSCNTLEDVAKVLNYGRTLAVSESNTNYYMEIEPLQDLILELMFQFDTFMSIVRCNYSGKNTVQDWIDFSECNLIEELIATLEHHRIEESIIIYNRLDGSTIVRLNERDIETILEVLNNIPLEKQLPFLHVFLPLTLSYIPTSLNLFIKWIIGKIYQLEMKYPKDFPENAIEFIKKMELLLKNDVNTTINFQQQNAIDQKYLQQLTEVYQALERLQILKSEYRVVISFQQYLQQKETLIEMLLTRVIYSADNEHFLENFIRKFTFNSYCEPDQIFKDIIKDIVKYAEEYWIKVAPVILNSISSINIKLQATLIILKSANVPWCSVVRDIAHHSLHYTHPLVEEIIQEIEYEPKCVVLKKEPYKLNKQSIDKPEYLKFIIGRIIYCNEPTMIEDIYQVCKDAKEKHEANILLINHFIKIGEFEKALDILDNNSTEEIIDCCKILKNTATIAINNTCKIDYLQENYYKIIGPIFRRLQDNASDTKKQSLQNYLESLQNVYKIQKDFDIKVTASNLESQKCKHNILMTLISNILLDLQESNDILSCIKYCEKISTYLKIEQNQVLLKLCEHVGDFNIILKATKIIFTNDCTPDILCRIATLILNCVTLPSSPFGNHQELIEESLLKNGKVDLSASIKGLRLANEIIVKAILHSNNNEIGNCIEIANWIQSTYYLIQDERKNGSTSLKSIYGTDLVLPSVSALNTVKYVFQFYRKLMNNCVEPNIKYLTYFNYDVPKLDEEQLISEIQILQSTIKLLCTEGHALTAYKLLRRLQGGLVYKLNISPEVQSNLNEILNQSTQQLLHNIFTSRFIDEDLSYTLLLSCDINYSKRFLIQSLRYYKREALKFKTIAQIRLRLLQYHNIDDGQDLCKQIIHLSKWWKRIQNCQMPYEQFFKKSSEEVVEKMITFNHLNIVSLEEFCFDFNLNVQNYYEFYLKNLLLNWKPNYEVQTNLSGKKQLIIKNCENKLIQDCMEVIDVIKDKELVCVTLNNIWALINFYHYEVFMCILNILSILKPASDNNQKNLLLLFLKNYTRVSKPGQTEMEEWYTLYPDTRCIDPLAEWRLPFTLTLFTNKIWNIIRPEMNLKTYTKWFEVISVLKKNLTKDDICTYVIKDVVSSDVFKKRSSDGWILHPKHKDLLLEIDECLQHISNKEQATSAVYCLTTSIPGGADQVDAITLCYKYAQAYKKQSPQSDDVQRAVIKIKKKYLSYSTTHILHTNQLADKKYLEMVSHPVEELIEALYSDDRILKKNAIVTSHCPDINKAVDELAALHRINIQEIRFTLIRNWLLSDSSTADFNLNNSVCLASSLDNQNKHNPTYSDNILRASYVCTSNDISVWRSLLLKLGNVESNESRNFNFKANALKCFHNISNIETIEKAMDITYEEFCNFINKLILISGLECFGFTLNIESLDKYNKIDLLNRLAYHITSPVGVKTMASVCIAYMIDESKYWTVIINSMLKLNMMEELKTCVNFLRKSFKFHSKKFYTNAWQAVVNNSFDIPPNTSQGDIKHIFTENLYFIQSCPVLFSIDLEYVIKKCFKFKMCEFAAVILQYLPKEKQIFYLTEISQLDQNIHEKLDDLSRSGFWGISFVKDLLGMLKN